MSPQVALSRSQTSEQPQGPVNANDIYEEANNAAGHGGELDGEDEGGDDGRGSSRRWTNRRQIDSRDHLLQVRDAAHAIEAVQYISSDPFWVAYVADRTDESYELTEDSLQLMPSRVMGYVLRDRKFVQLDVQLLRKIEPQEDAFDSLKMTRRTRRCLGQDLIQGKGEGLVILLHGVPGVGKTATTEAAAQFKKLPLLGIACGDLGLTPKEVEKSLKEAFRLALMWDCILLLDEADTFLAERTRDDLERNALVSVFLRMLEYYSGILFLTTNQVGSLDEAFKSRIHMSIYYPPLTRRQTLQIFEMNISRIEKVDQQRHHAHLPTAREGNEGKDTEVRDASVTHERQERLPERPPGWLQRRWSGPVPRARHTSAGHAISRERYRDVMVGVMVDAAIAESRKCEIAHEPHENSFWSS